MSSVRENGDKFAEDLTDELNSQLEEHAKFKLTKNSGATRRDGDAKNELYIIDYKSSERSPLPASIPSKEVAKVIDQAEKYGKQGILVSETRDGIYATINLETLIELLNK